MAASPWDIVSVEDAATIGNAAADRLSAFRSRSNPNAPIAPPDDGGWDIVGVEPARTSTSGTGIDAIDAGLTAVDTALTKHGYNPKPDSADIDQAGIDAYKAEQQATAERVAARRAELGTDDRAGRGQAMRLFDSLAAGLAGAVGSSAEYIGRKTGIESLESFGQSAQEESAALMPEDANLGEKLAQGGGSMLSFVVPGMGTAGAVVRGASLLARAGTIGARGVAAASKAAPWAAAGMSTALESAGVAQEAYDKALAETGNKDLAEERALVAGLLSAPVVLITDKLGIFGDMGKVLKGPRRIGTAMLTEGIQEGAQGVITNIAGYQPMGEGVAEQTLLGGLVGGGFKGFQVGVERLVGEAKAGADPLAGGNDIVLSPDGTLAMPELVKAAESNPNMLAAVTGQYLAMNEADGEAFLAKLAEQGKTELADDIRSAGEDPKMAAVAAQLAEQAPFLVPQIDAAVRRFVDGQEMLTPPQDSAAQQPALLPEGTAPAQESAVDTGVSGAASPEAAVDTTLDTLGNQHVSTVEPTVNAPEYAVDGAGASLAAPVAASNVAVAETAAAPAVVPETGSTVPNSGLPALDPATAATSAQQPADPAAKVLFDDLRETYRQDFDPASIKVVSQEKVAPFLTKVAKAVKAAFGVDVTFVDIAEGGIKLADGSTHAWNGVSLRGKSTIAINVRRSASGYSLLNTIGHELAHQLKEKHPAIWNMLRDAAFRHVSRGAKTQFRSFLATSIAAENKDASPEELSQMLEAEYGEEVVSEVVGEQWATQAYWELAYSLAPNIGFAARIKGAVTELLNRAGRAFMGTGFVQGKKDVDAIRSAVANGFAAWQAMERATVPAHGNTRDVIEQKTGAAKKPAPLPTGVNKKQAERQREENRRNVAERVQGEAAKAAYNIEEQPATAENDMTRLAEGKAPQVSDRPQSIPNELLGNREKEATPEKKAVVADAETVVARAIKAQTKALTEVIERATGVRKAKGYVPEGGNLPGARVPQRPNIAFSRKAKEKQKSPLSYMIDPAEAAARVGRRMKREAGVGAPINPRTVLGRGKDRLVVGPPTERDWLDRARKFLPDAEFKDARQWYSQLHDFLTPIYGEDAPKYALAWLLSQQRASPSKGMMNVLRAHDIAAGKNEIKLAGLNADSLLAVLRGQKLSGGVGAKLMDFVDSELGLSTRTYMNNDPRGRQPAAIDVWAYRDLGFIDQTVHDFIAKTYGKEAAEAIKIDPSRGETNYEHGIDRYNDIVEYLNKNKVDGGGWTAREVQAIGWVAMQAAMGVKAEFVRDIVNANTRRVSIGLAPGTGTPLAETLNGSEIPKARAMQIVNELAERAGIKALSADIGIGAYMTYVEGAIQVDAFASPEAVADFADMLGYALQQTEIIATRGLKSGNRTAVDLFAPEFADAGAAQRWFGAFLEEQGENVLSPGFQQVKVGGRHGVRLINFGGKWQGGRLDALRGAAERAAAKVGLIIEDAVAFNVSLESTKNDWTQDRAGEAFLNSLRNRGRLSDAQWLADRYAPSRFVLGEAPVEGGGQFSRVGFTGPAEPAVRSGAEGDGRSQRGVSVAGVHFGKTGGLSSLSGTAFGTGIRGKEQERLRESKDARIKRRVYFYVGGTGEPFNFRRREAGLGPHAYRAQLDSLYDPRAHDPIKHRVEYIDERNGIRDDDATRNNWESALLDAGYSGYVVHNPDIAVVLNRDVPVEYVGDAANQRLTLSFSRTLEEDAAGQVAFLQAEAKKLGHDSPDALLAADPAAFMALAVRWRDNNPRSEFSRQFDTPEFKHWFDDGFFAEEGKPVIWYHGTAQNVKSFRPKQAGAVFLTRNPKFANGFTAMSEEWMTANTDKVGISDGERAEIDELAARLIESTQNDNGEYEMFMQQHGVWNGDAARHELDLSDNRTVMALRKTLMWKTLALDYLPSRANIMPLVTNVKNPFDYENPAHVSAVVEHMAFDDADDRRHLTNTLASGSWHSIELGAVQNAIKALGHDAFHVKEGGVKNLGVYDPKAVKSAMNRGTWDATDRLSFSRQSIEDVVSGKRRLPLEVSETPEVLLALGFPQLPLTIMPKVIDKVITGKGGIRGTMSVDQLLKLREELESPVAVFKSATRDESVVVVTRLKINGDPVVVAIERNSDQVVEISDAFLGKSKARVVSNDIDSAYGKSEFTFDAWLGNNLLRYWDASKANGLATEVRLAFARAAQRGKWGDNPVIGPARLQQRATAKAAVRERMDKRAVGRENAEHVSTAFSRQPLPTVGNKFTLPAETRGERLQRWFQDRMNRLAVTQAEVLKQGGTVTEASDFYRAEERFSGRTGTRLERFKENVVKPLIDDMAATGIDMDELALFLYAQHAQERNAWIAAINPKMPDGGSGMTNSDAQQILATFAADPQYADYQRLASKLYSINKATQKLMVDAGLITQAVADGWNARSKFYVPLRGFEVIDEFGEKGTGTGRGFDIRGAESRRALGRESRAAQIVENVIMGYQKALVRGEKNRVGKAFLNFVLSNPDSRLWEVDSHRMKPVFHKNGGVNMFGLLDGEVRYRGEKVTDPKRTIVVKHNGIEHAITVHDSQLLHSLTAQGGALSLDGEQAHRILRAMTGMNRFLSKMWTALNPVFTLVNFSRDFVTAMIHSANIGGAGFMGSVAKGIFPAMAGIREVERGGTANGTWAKWYEQYKDDGGKFGFYHFGDLEQTQDELAGLLKHARMGKGGGVRAGFESSIKALHKLEDFVMDYNAVIENAARVSAYRAAVESGKSRAEAASIAKNLTVNFNRKGELTTVIGSFYLFFNPAVQGVARIAQAAKNHPAQFGAMIGGLVTMGVILGMLASGDEDDEGTPRWDKDVPNYEKSRNLVFMLGGGDRLTIPLPYGYGFFVSLGYALADLSRGQPPAKVAAALWDSFTNHYSPVGGTENPLAAVAPTALDPLVEIWSNQNAFGGPMMPEAKNMAGVPVPDSERFWGTSRGTAFQKFASWLNEATGGSEVEEGWISMSPESMKSLVRYYTGGAGNFIKDTITTLDTMRTLGGDAAVQQGTIPFLKTLYKADNARGDQRYYYEARDRAMTALEAAKRFYDSDQPEVLDRLDRNAGMAQLGESIRQMGKAMSGIRLAEIEVKDDPDMTDRERYEALQKLDEDRRAILKQFNAEFYRAERESRGIKQ